MRSNELKCDNCGENICIFLQFEADVVGLRTWHQQAALLGNNRARRKYAFRTYHRWRKGFGGERVEFERCVVIGIRSWYPSRAYMGFYADEDQTMHRRAVNLYGDVIDAWWEFRDGDWQLVE